MKRASLCKYRHPDHRSYWKTRPVRRAGGASIITVRGNRYRRPSSPLSSLSSLMFDTFVMVDWSAADRAGVTGRATASGVCLWHAAENGEGWRTRQPGTLQKELLGDWLAAGAGAWGNGFVARFRLPVRLSPAGFRRPGSGSFGPPLGGAPSGRRDRHAPRGGFPRGRTGKTTASRSAAEFNRARFPGWRLAFPGGVPPPVRTPPFLLDPQAPPAGHGQRTGARGSAGLGRSAYYQPRQPCWKAAGRRPPVGGQALTGIPVVRGPCGDDPRWIGNARIWPFRNWSSVCAGEWINSWDRRGPIPRCGRYRLAPMNPRTRAQVRFRCPFFFRGARSRPAKLGTAVRRRSKL